MFQAPSKHPAKKNIPLAILGIHFYLSTLAMPFLLRLSIAFCSDQRINMANPREQFAQLTGKPRARPANASPTTGFSKRVHSLTQNFQEGLVPFASAVLMATIQHVPLQTATSLACLHMLARAVYTLAFLLNVPMLRAVAYYISTFCSLSLMAYSVSPKFDERFQAVSRAVQSYALAIQLFKK